MSLAQVIAQLNRLQADGVVENYAIGGAVAATFYLEPVATLDVDVFFALATSSDQVLIDVRPLYARLSAAGAVVEGEHVIIADWPVQFLPSTGPLADEALAKAVTMEVDGTSARVFTAEHLAAIALQTGRPKDLARLVAFAQSGVLNARRFRSILDRHGLTSKWAEFRRQFR